MIHEYRNDDVTGMQRFSAWLPELPFNVYPTDIDFCLQRANDGRVLVMEFKPVDKRVSYGQQLTFKGLSELAHPKGGKVTVLSVEDPYAGAQIRNIPLETIVRVTRFSGGTFNEQIELTVAQLARLISNWCEK